MWFYLFIFECLSLFFSIIVLCFLCFRYVTAVTTTASGYSYWHYGRKTVKVLNTRSQWPQVRKCPEHMRKLTQWHLLVASWNSLHKTATSHVDQSVASCWVQLITGWQEAAQSKILYFLLSFLDWGLWCHRSRCQVNVSFVKQWLTNNNNNNKKRKVLICWCFLGNLTVVWKKIFAVFKNVRKA